MKLGDLARTLGLELGPAADADLEISGVAPLEAAEAADLVYVAEARYASALEATGAGAVVCTADMAERAPCAVVVSPSPAADFARATRLFATRVRTPEGVHATAVVAESATLGRGVRIGPYAVVGDGAELGENVEVNAHVTLYPGVRIGPGTVVHAGCVLREGTIVGARCVLQPNVVLGGDGFGFAKRADGGYEKIEQLGIVRVEDDVEIGAGTTVDRATFVETAIGRGSKLDNLVQVGHNSTVGENSILCAQVGLAGSTTIGRGVTLAGQVGVAGHLSIGDNTIATAQTGIPNSVAANTVVSGYPAIENRAWLKSSAVFVRLPDLQKTVRRLEARIAELEAKAGSR